MDTAIYDILEEPTGSAYDAILDFCARRSASCSLVVREGDAKRDGIVRFSEKAKPHLIYAESQSQWPGTRLSGHTAMVYRYQLSKGLVALLKMCARGLFDWSAPTADPHAPSLPEDLAIYRADGSVFLASIAHERDAWLELTATECREASDLPLKLSRRRMTS